MSGKSYAREEVLRKLKKHKLSVEYVKIEGIHGTKTTDEIKEVTAKRYTPVGIRLFGMIDFLKVPFRRV